MGKESSGVLWHALCTALILSVRMARAEVTDKCKKVSPGQHQNSAMPRLPNAVCVMKLLIPCYGAGNADTLQKGTEV